MTDTTLAATPVAKTISPTREVWLSLKPEDIFPGTRMQRALHFVRRGDHLYPNTGLRNLIATVPAPMPIAYQRR